MRLLLIADNEERAYWDDWSDHARRELADVDVILSAGDLDADYLEFLVTMLNVPLVYVRGNHDGAYHKRPPEGCIDADGKIVDVECGRGKPKEKLRILGLGGSMKYNEYGTNMYTEEEMHRRISKLKGTMLKNTLAAKLGGKGGFDILLTHAPCKGWGDLDDLPHSGFECFNGLLYKYSPRLHCYGHVHREYSTAADGEEGYQRCLTHPSGTLLINAGGHYIYDLK